MLKNKYINLSILLSMSGFLHALEVQDTNNINQKNSNTKEVNIYEEASKSSKLIEKKDLMYLDETVTLEEKNIRGDIYPWFKIEKGWVNIAYMKKSVAKKTTAPQATQEPLLSSEISTSPTNEADTLRIVPKQEDTVKVEVIHQEKKPKKEVTKTDSKYNYFIGVGLNYNVLSVNKQDKAGIIILNEQADDSATSTNIQIGTYIQNYTLSLNYEMLNLNDVKIATTYLSLDYTFKNFLNPFVGVSLGMSDLEWQIDPLTDSKTKDDKLSSMIYGIQAGIHYPIYLNWSVYGILSYQKFDFTTSLISTPAKAEIRHEDKTSLGVGVRYSF